MLSRRELIKLGLYGGTAGALHLTHLDSGALGWALDEEDERKKKKHHHKHKGGGGGGGGGGASGGPFTTPMRVPPVRQPVDPATLPGVPTFNDGIPTTYYETRAMQGPVQIFAGTGQQPTVVWGYDGLYLAQTIVANIGERVVLRLHNDLGVTQILHHHGSHVPGISDGSALFTQQLAPGTFKDYVYPNDDDIAATHWYHDHDLDFTGHNVFMGLEGAFILHDAIEQGLNLPGNPSDPAPLNEYPFDLPMVIQDRAFDANNQLVYNPFNHDGFIGDTFLVNGTIQPVVRVANRKYRFRILNGSNARFYQLSLSNGMPFRVIGSDGGLLTNAVDVTSFLSGPAERWEVIVDFSSLTPGPNTHVFLDNCLAQTNGRAPDGLSTNCTNPNPGLNAGVGSLLRFDVAFSAPDNSSSPLTLRTDLPVFNPAEAVNTRLWEFQRSQGAWQINGQFYDPTRTDAFVKVNTTEIWTLKNGGGGWYHPVHIHRNQFRILSRNGAPPGPLEQGLKDVFVLEGGDTVDVITKYTGATTVGDYVMHCHNVEHEDMRMMIRWNVS